MNGPGLDRSELRPHEFHVLEILGVKRFNFRLLSDYQTGQLTRSIAAHRKPMGSSVCLALFLLGFGSYGQDIRSQKTQLRRVQAVECYEQKKRASTVLQELLCLTDTQMGQIKTITDAFRFNAQAVFCDRNLTELMRDKQIKVLKLEKLTRINTCLTNRQQAIYKTLMDPNDELTASTGSPAPAVMDEANTGNPPN